MTETSKSLDGRVAIVTGAARGIGFAVAARLVADGASVAIADIDADAASQAAQRLGKRAVGLRLDVTDEEQWAAGIESIEAVFGPISILVSNAGIAGRAVPTWELSVAEWQQVIAIDLSGVFIGCRAVLPGMIERGYGRIVNIASIAGTEGNPNAVPYSAAKAGVIGLTKAIAKEVATTGVIVNAVTPAVIETDILKQLTDEHVAYMTSRIPMGRVGQPEEVAALVRFLCSDEVTFSTGAVFDISGGRATY
jgi:2-dehydro-3-deoxy-L-rhamnonate dehydrogenase (NAD+)